MTTTLPRLFAFQDLEIEKHAGGDQQPEDGEEFALLEQIGFAGLPDGVGDVGHGLMHRQRLGLPVLHQAEAAPMAHITMPKYISVTPLTPPKPSKVTASSGGILMSASLARRLAADKQQNERGNELGGEDFSRMHNVVLAMSIGCCCSSAAFCGL